MAVVFDASLYAKNNAHHRAFDEEVLAPLCVGRHFAILDLGCGTGELTARLAALVPEGRVIGIDASAALIEHAAAAHQEFKNLSFVHLRAQQLKRLLEIDKALPERFDLVISTAALHWIPRQDHAQLYRAVYELLAAGGVFRAQFGGAGQIAKVRLVLDEESERRGGATSPWYFPTATEVGDRLLRAGFEAEPHEVRLVDQVRSFPDLESFVGWLDSQVFVAYEPSLGVAFSAFRSAAIDRLAVEARHENGSYDQPFVRLDLLVRRPTQGA